MVLYTRDRGRRLEINLTRDGREDTKTVNELINSMLYYIHVPIDPYSDHCVLFFQSTTPTEFT